MVDNILKVINPKKSKFTKTTDKYHKDNTYDIIDIEEAINKNKFIQKCEKDKFIYLKLLSRDDKKFNLEMEEYYFQKDNGVYEEFSQFFDIISVLGRGGFGGVFRAYDKKNKMEVAIKIISKKQYKDINKVLYTEIQNQQNLDHKNIVKLYYIKENDNYFFLVQELMNGGSLRQLIIKRFENNDKYLFRDDECSTIIRNLLEGLNYIHNSNVIHRDIKPENIMFLRENDLNSLKICDFGVSTTFNEQELERGSICGSLKFMAPETFRKQANETSDIWATGIILYILSSGGMHPIYRQSMTQEKYINELKLLKEWTLPEQFPILAKNLFFKLCKLEKQYRYEIHRALSHPWITRSIESSIPLNTFEKIWVNEGKMKLKLIFKCLVFLSGYKIMKLKKSTKTNKASSKNFISKKIKIKVDTIKPMNFSKKNSPTNHIQEKMIKAQDTKKKNSFFLKNTSENKNVEK